MNTGEGGESGRKNADIEAAAVCVFGSPVPMIITVPGWPELEPDKRGRLSRQNLREDGEGIPHFRFV